MRESTVPATVVIDKPKAGIVSTKSSTAQWIDEDYFGGTPCSDVYPEPRQFRDSDCGGRVRSEYTTDYELAEDQLERAVHERNGY